MNKKQSLYFPDEMLRELRAESERQDRSLSWLVQRAWTVAKSRLKEYAIRKHQPFVQTAAENLNSKP